MALAVCLLLDRAGDRAVRRLWERLEHDGISTLLTHTHGRHVPHVSLAVLRSYDLVAVTAALRTLPDAGPTTLRFDALGMFRRSRTWLAPAVTADLARRQEAVVDALETAGADLHQHYRPGAWVPHCTIAVRTHLERLPAIAAATYDVLPLVTTADRAALVDTSTGTVHALPTVP